MLQKLDYAIYMSKLIDGLPRSTYFYRKSHPKRLTFTEAAKQLSITRQSVHRTARKIGVKIAQEVVDYYEAKRATEITWKILPSPIP